MIITGDLILFFVPFGYPGQNGWHVGYFEELTEGGYDKLPLLKIYKQDGKLYSYYATPAIQNLYCLEYQSSLAKITAERLNWKDAIKWQK